MRGLAIRIATIGLVVVMVAGPAEAVSYFVTYASPSVLYVVDEGTSCGVSAHGLGVDFVTDIAVSEAGEIYACTNQRLYRVDLSTFKVTDIGEFGNASSRTMTGLDFGANDALYGIDGDGQIWTIAVGDAQTSNPVNTGYVPGDLACYAGPNFYFTGLVGSVAHLMRIDLTAQPVTVEDLGVIVDNLQFASLDFVEGGKLIAFEYDSNGPLGRKYEITNYLLEGAGVLRCDTGIISIGGAASRPWPTPVTRSSWGSVKRDYR